MHNRMAEDAWLLAMRLVSVYLRADAMRLSLCIRGLMHNRMAVHAWL